MDQHLCSVLIVNYNGGPLLVDCVRTALSSSFAVEVLVWDNASCDDSIAVLKAAFVNDSRLRVFSHPLNIGFAGGVNCLLEEATGSWLLLLNPDCLVATDTIARVVDALTTNPRAGMGGCLIRNPDGAEQAGCRRLVPTPWRSLVHIFHLDRVFPNQKRFQNIALYRRPLPVNPVEVEAISGAFMMISREALDMVGPMDSDYFMHCEDVDWCMRFRAAGWRILFVPLAVAVHAKGECSRIRPLFVEWHKHKGMIRFYRKFFRRQYSWLFFGLIVAAVWCRFGAIAVSWGVRRRLLSKESDNDRKERAAFVARALAGMETGANEVSPDGQEYGGRNHSGSAVLRVLITGATSQIGHFLLPMLRTEGAEALVMSRRPPPSQASGTCWFNGDLVKDNPFAVAERIDIWFHLAKLPLALPWLMAAKKAGVKRFLGFSSTSIFTKQCSSSLEEQELVAELQWAEAELSRFSELHNFNWTLLRPTLIYGCGVDRNISFILSFIRKVGFFPLVGGGHGLRQPVHAEDLARASIMAAFSPEAVNRAYDLGGGERLTYRAMVERLFASLGRPALFLPLPLSLAKIGVWMSWLHPACRHLTPAMFERMNVDMVADYSAAVNDFGYAPRSFMAENPVPGEK